MTTKGRTLPSRRALLGGLAAVAALLGMPGVLRAQKRSWIGASAASQPCARHQGASGAAAA